MAVTIDFFARFKGNFRTWCWFRFYPDARLAVGVGQSRTSSAWGQSGRLVKAFLKRAGNPPERKTPIGIVGPASPAVAAAHFDGRPNQLGLRMVSDEGRRPGPSPERKMRKPI